MNSIKLEQTVSRKIRNLQINHLGSELVMMDIENYDFINFNLIGTIIWEMLEQQTTVQDLFKQLLEKFDVEEAICKSELFEFLQKLQEHELIEFSEK